MQNNLHFCSTNAYSLIVNKGVLYNNINIPHFLCIIADKKRAIRLSGNHGPETTVLDEVELYPLSFTAHRNFKESGYIPRLSGS